MPTFRSYKRDPGYYIRGNIDGSFVTLQVSKTAEKFLKGLGYGHDDSLNWHLIIPLMDEGYITTGGSGPSKQEVQAGANTTQASKLSSREADALEEFLNPDPSYEPDETTVGRIKQFDSALSRQEIVEACRDVHDPDAFEKSVQIIANHHPISADGFRVSRQHPAYEFSTNGIEWTAFEPLRDESTPDEWVVKIRPDGGRDGSQLLRFRRGRLAEWKVYGGPSVESQRADLEAVLPDIAYLFDRYPGYSPAFEDWELTPDVALHELVSEERSWADDLFSTIRSRYATTDRSATDCDGTVVAVNSNGYGRVQTDTRFTASISIESNPDLPDGIDIGDRIRFDIVADGDDWVVTDAVATDRANEDADVDGDENEEDDTEDDDEDAEPRVREALESLGCDEATIDAWTETIATTRNTDALLESIREFRSVRDAIESLSVFRKRSMQYQLATDGIEWRLRDTRESGLADQDFLVIYSESDRIKHSLYITDGALDRWVCFEKQHREYQKRSITGSVVESVCTVVSTVIRFFAERFDPYSLADSSWTADRDRFEDASAEELDRIQSAIADALGTDDSGTASEPDDGEGAATESGRRVGTLKEINRDRGYGYISKRDGGSVYFQTGELASSDAEIGETVSYRLEDGMATGIRRSDEDADSSSIPPSPADEAELRGPLLFYNRQYGKVYSTALEEAFLFERDAVEVPETAPGTGFRFTVRSRDDGTLRAVNLQHDPSAGVSAKTAKQLRTEGSAANEVANLDGTAFLRANATDAEPLLDRLRTYRRLGIDLDYVERAVSTIGRPLSDVVSDVEFASDGRLVVTVDPADDDATVRLEVDRDETDRIAFTVETPSGPDHCGEFSQGNFLGWRPQAESSVSTEDRDRFIRSQGRYVELVAEILSEAGLLERRDEDSASG